MTPFESITDARTGIMDFRADHFAEIPEHMRERFRTTAASPSPVDQIVGLGEMIYANRDQVGDNAKLLGASLIAYATVNSWHGLSEGNRGDAIVLNLRKDAGEVKTAPAAPEPRAGSRIEPEAPADTPQAGE